ncbi:MAG: peptide-methionine (R)-S-oxide reductase MsrB [Variovorax sp.]
MTTTRRKALSAIGALGGLFVGARALTGATSANAAKRNYEVTHSEAEWKQLLTPAQYNVLREEGTERPFSSPLNNEKREGTYSCAGCQLPVYGSKTKFESGTGWPSFYQPIAGSVDEVADNGLFMKRTAIDCHRCGGHLGHVFDDGPKPTGLRYCMNGLALQFAPASQG